MKKKKTFGEEYVKNRTENIGQTQTVGETRQEMGKDYMKSLEKVVNDHKHIDDPYYIMEILKPHNLLEGVIQVTHIARRTRPLPEWGLGLYKVDNKKGDITLEWGLPTEDEAYLMMHNPDGWNSKVINDIRAFSAQALV